MHELSVCQGMITQVLRIASERGATAVTRIRVQIGPLSGVEPALLREAFPLAAAGTLVDGADLAIEQTGIRVRCHSCGAESEASPNRLVCAACGDWHTELLGGDEMLLRNIELIEGFSDGGSLREAAADSFT